MWGTQFELQAAADYYETYLSSHQETAARKVPLALIHTQEQCCTWQVHPSTAFVGKAVGSQVSDGVVLELMYMKATCPLQQYTNQSVHPVVCHCQVT